MNKKVVLKIVSTYTSEAFIIASLTFAAHYLSHNLGCSTGRNTDNASSPTVESAEVIVSVTVVS